MSLPLLRLAAMALFLSATAMAADQPPPRVDVLVLSQGMDIDPVLDRQLAADGVHLVVRKIGDPLSMAMLRQFHVVLNADGLNPDVEFFLRDHVSRGLTTRANLVLLKRYIEDGGGFFFTPPYGSTMLAESLSEFLAPYGAGLQSAQIRDDAHAFAAAPLPTAKPADYFEYAWTTAITAHPATIGVKRLYYPTSELRWDDMYATPVISLRDPAWTTLVAGMPGSVAAKGFDYYTWKPVDTRPPAIAAVRGFGAGRIGLFTPNRLYTFWKPYVTFTDGWFLENHTGRIDGVLMEKGDGITPSDGRTLITGMLRWLAEGARAKGMGGYEEKTFAAIPPPPAVPAPDWLYSWQPGDGNRWFKVVVGARSAFSDGSGSIADYAAAAKAAGVGVLYMTETFERFAPARWAEFRAACAAASDASLRVVAGLDIPDTAGNRYLLLGSPLFPSPSQLNADGTAMSKPHYLCLTFPKGITVQHRPTGSSVPHELHKHFHGVSLSTYRDGKLEDNGLPAFQWQTFRFSNPMPFAVHETYRPADLAAEATTGHQMLAAAPSLDDLMWYLGAHGTAHFWESPLHLQISAGPRLTRFGGSPSTQPGEAAMKNALSFTLTSDEPIREVRLLENFNLYRRWTPNATTFSLDNVKLPEEHVNWLQLVATDAKGRTVVSPGIGFGRQICHTWRCGDRQNWWNFPNIYTGTDVSQFDIRVPVFGTDEGAGMFPGRTGPQRGDNMAALLDFTFASPAVYIQDVFLDQRYPRARFNDAAYDAMPANATARSRVYEARVRYRQFFQHDNKVEKDDFLPHLKSIELALRRPTEPSGRIFPIITTLHAKNAQVDGGMAYAYADAAGNEVTGTLAKDAVLDLPRGGRIGGFIALSDGLRVDGWGNVGFAAPAMVNGALPVGTSWQASFATVWPAEADAWRAMMGLRGPPPFTLSLSSGKLDALAYVASCTADGWGITGQVAKAAEPAAITALSAGVVNHDNEGHGAKLTAYRLPLEVAGINYNWPAALIRDGQAPQPVDVFEGRARARLDVGTAGGFYLGNTVIAGDSNLRIGVLKWTADVVVLELNNPTDAAIATSLRTVAATRGLQALERQVSVPAGTSLTISSSQP